MAYADSSTSVISNLSLEKVGNAYKQKIKFLSKEDLYRMTSTPYEKDDENIKTLAAQGYVIEGYNDEKYKNLSDQEIGSLIYDKDYSLFVEIADDNSIDITWEKKLDSTWFYKISLCVISISLFFYLIRIVFLYIITGNFIFLRLKSE